MKLTQKVVDSLSLPPGKPDVTYWDDDCPGLAVRIQGKAKRWIVRYRVKGDARARQIQATLGPVAGLSLRDARSSAVAHTQPARKGIDVAAEARAQAAADQQR